MSFPLLFVILLRELEKEKGDVMNMSWCGFYENSPCNMKEAYTHHGKTEPDILGQGALWIRRGMMTCCRYLLLALKRRKLNQRIPPRVVMNTMSKWPYPRECSKCSLAGGCAEFLKRSEVCGTPAFPYPDPDKVLKGEHTGWENLKWEQRFHNYRKIDSLEDAYPTK